MELKRLKKQDLFYIAWIIMVVHFCVANSNAARFNTAIASYIAVLLFIFKIFIEKKYIKRELIEIFLLLIGGVLSLRATSDMRVLWFAIVLCASKGIDFDKTIVYSFRTMMCCVVIFIILYSIGIIDGVNEISDKGMRLGFGLGHANMCSAYYTLLMVQYIYIKYSKLKVEDFFLFFIGANIIFALTKSSTGILVAITTLLFTCLLKYFSYKKFNSKLLIALFILLITFFTLAPILYNDRLLWLNIILSRRLDQAHFYFLKYGIGLFGKDVSYDLTKWNTDYILDIGYAKMLLNNGIFYYCCVVAGYLISMKQAINNKDYKLITLIGSMIVYMCTENVATYIFMNVSMLLFSQIIFINKKDDYLLTNKQVRGEKRKINEY